jgi:hypothetical protein
MMARIKSPLAATALSFLLSIAMGVYLCIQAAGPMLEIAARSHAKVVAPKENDGWDFWTIEMENLSNDLKEERARLHK